MNERICLTLSVLVTLAVLAVGCASAPPPTREAVGEAPPAATELAATEREAIVEEPTEEPEVVMPVTPSADGERAQSGDHTAVTLPNRPNRLIVKNAELKLLVSDTDIAIDRVTQITADTGGYIVSSRVRYDEWLGEQYKYASITIGVPVDQFETAMRRLRNLAIRVVDETASGQDVTDEYVDLQSRLGNLEATRDRIRDFLAQAQTVEESLRVNEELAAIEEQIEQVEGRMNYLFDRAAYSTITVQIDPDLPVPTPAPTPTPMPTPTPTPTPTPVPPWTPVDTARQAGHTLGFILRGVTEITIWLVIVVVPLVAPPVLVLWAVYRWIKRRAA